MKYISGFYAGLMTAIAVGGVLGSLATIVKAKQDGEKNPVNATVNNARGFWDNQSVQEALKVMKERQEQK